ncbi:hypothetical protein GCM10007977_075740 [Dactylosporangium sucinum]|uniref:Anti-sigma regulatory factor (Ser/Thr protein kinase) n=1 Tax=Dactylosporangium sucinum TaxID=1424081 RepID=A0A917U744_9ACTN|nr:hypothetical protein GCM10007977_075740 [Dactylosporangium sucinum]
MCWAYDEPQGFLVRAREWVAEGLAAGNWVWYVPGGSVEAVEGAHVVPPGAAYPGRFDPDHQVRVYREATERALAAGYSGLRVVAEATMLAKGQVDLFARYEHLVDRYMHRAPMTALCAYDRTVLAKRDVGRLACVHPETNDDVGFQLYAGDDLVLTGELDHTNHELFAAAVEHAHGVRVDVERLRFVDHRALLYLERRGRGGADLLHARQRERGRRAARQAARPAPGARRMRTGAAAGHQGYFHEAVVYDTDADLLAVAVPFVLDGIAAGEPTVVAFGERTAGLLREAAGTDGIDFLAGDAVYGRPAAVIRAYRRLLAGLVAGGATQIRLLGELPPEVFGRTWDWWARYEAAVNHAYDEFPLWSLCAYDARLAPRAVIDDVERTHPRLATTDGQHLDSGLFVDPVGYLRTPRAGADDPLQRRPPDAAWEDPSPAVARQVVRAVGDGQGLREERLDGLVIAVSEVVTNAQRHGRPPVGLRVWGGGGRVVVEVTDRGEGLDDPYAGLLPGGHQAIGGLGLWITYQSCDHVHATRTPAGFVVTLTVG